MGAGCVARLPSPPVAPPHPSASPRPALPRDFDLVCRASGECRPFVGRLSCACFFCVHCLLIVFIFSSLSFPASPPLVTTCGPSSQRFSSFQRFFVPPPPLCKCRPTKGRLSGACFFSFSFITDHLSIVFSFFVLRGGWPHCPHLRRIPALLLIPAFPRAPSTLLGGCCPFVGGSLVRVFFVFVGHLLLYFV